MNMLNLSIAVTAAAVLVLLIKLLFGNQITPRGHMRLWLLVAVSFIFSPIAEFMPESSLAVRNWLPQSETTVETVWVEPYEDLNARGFAIEEQGNYYAVQKDHLSLRVPFSDKTLDAEFAATTSRAKLENWLWFAGYGSDGYLAAYRKLHTKKETQGAAGQQGCCAACGTGSGESAGRRE